MYILFEPERETLGGVKRVVWELNLKDFADIDQIASNCVTIERFEAILAPYLKSAPTTQQSLVTHHEPHDHTYFITSFVSSEFS